MCDSFGNRLLHEFAKAIKERDGGVGLGGKIVRFARLRDNLDESVFPHGWVERMCKAANKQCGDMCRNDRPEPFEDGPGYQGRTWGGGGRGGLEVLFEFRG